jgi:transcriptional regulator with XRE-family HTH domain
MRLGNKIRTIRLLKNYSTDKLASHLDMSVSNFGKIERNEIDLNFDKLEKVAQLFGMTIDELKNYNDSVTLNVTDNKGQVGYIQNITLPINEKDHYEKERVTSNFWG